MIRKLSSIALAMVLVCFMMPMTAFSNTTQLQSPEQTESDVGNTNTDANNQKDDNASIDESSDKQLSDIGNDKTRIALSKATYEDKSENEKTALFASASNENGMTEITANGGISLLSGSADSDHDPNCGNPSGEAGDDWHSDDNGWCIAADGTCVIPDGTTKIPSYEFSGKDKLRSVVIPSGATSMGTAAFGSCYNLRSVTIPDSMTAISDYAFSSCYALADIEIPDSVTSIGSYAFSKCYALVTVSIPSNLSSLGEYAFSECEKLPELTLPSSLSNLGGYAFNGCKAFTSFTIPDTVTTRPDALLYGCTSLQSATIPDSWTEIPWGLFSGCSSLASVNVPSKLKKIKGSAFNGCSSLEEFIIPDAVTDIGGYAFASCRSLVRISESSSNPLPSSLGSTDRRGYGSVGQYVFTGCTSLASVEIPGSMKEIPIGMFQGCTSLEHLVIHEGITLIGDYAFRNGATSGSDGFDTPVVLPSSLVTLWGSSFQNAAYKHVILNDGLKTLGGQAFAGSKLTEIVIPDSVTGFSNSMFEGCASLSSVTLPENPALTTLTESAFSGCKSLKSIVIPDTFEKIENKCFRSSGLEEIDLGNGVKAIGNSAFDGNALKELTLPENVTNVGDYAFYKNALESITFENPDVVLGVAVFNGNDTLTHYKQIKGLSQVELEKLLTSHGNAYNPSMSGGAFDHLKDDYNYWTVTTSLGKKFDEKLRLDENILDPVQDDYADYIAAGMPDGYKYVSASIDSDSFTIHLTYVEMDYITWTVSYVTDAAGGSKTLRANDTCSVREDKVASEAAGDYEIPFFTGYKLQQEIVGTQEAPHVILIYEEDHDQTFAWKQVTTFENGEKQGAHEFVFPAQWVLDDNIPIAIAPAVDDYGKPKIAYDTTDHVITVNYRELVSWHFSFIGLPEYMIEELEEAYADGFKLEDDEIPDPGNNFDIPAAPFGYKVKSVSQPTKMRANIVVIEYEPDYDQTHTWSITHQDENENVLHRFDKAHWVHEIPEASPMSFYGFYAEPDTIAQNIDEENKKITFTYTAIPKEDWTVKIVGLPEDDDRADDKTISVFEGETPSEGRDFEVPKFKGYELVGQPQIDESEKTITLSYRELPKDIAWTVSITGLPMIPPAMTEQKINLAAGDIPIAGVDYLVPSVPGYELDGEPLVNESDHTVTLAYKKIKSENDDTNEPIDWGNWDSPWNSGSQGGSSTSNNWFDMSSLFSDMSNKLFVSGKNDAPALGDSISGITALAGTMLVALMTLALIARKREDDR